MNDINCPNCKTEISQIQVECDHCGFPLAGTEKEKAIFIGKQISNKSKIGDAKSSQNKVMYILYAVAAFQFFNAFRVYSNNLGLDNIIFFIILGVLFIVFGFLSPKRPILYISLALLLLLGYYTLLYISNPMFIMQGIIWKVLVLAVLFYGLALSLEEQKLKKKHKFLNDK